MGKFALQSALAGSATAVLVMLVVAARAVWTITAGKRWYQLKKL